MTASSKKHSKRINPRQAAREARKAAKRNEGITPDRIQKVHVLTDGRQLIELKPVVIPGYTYAF